jgi:hypothetical protein
MRKVTVMLPAVLATFEAIQEAIRVARVNETAIVLISGPSGDGKTEAVTAAAEKFDGAFMIRAHQVMTPFELLATWARQIFGCWGSERWSYRLRAELIKELKHRECKGRFTVFDEADYLARSRGHELLNIVRDIADETAHPLVLVSVSRLARRLAAASDFTAQIKSRLIGEVHFSSPSIEDAETLAQELLEVPFDSDLIEWCLKRSGQTLRGLIRWFEKFEAAALAAKLRKVGLRQARGLGLIPDSTPRAVQVLEVASGSPAENISNHDEVERQRA